MNDLISRQAAINKLKEHYFDKKLQSAKNDPCIIDAMTDLDIRIIKALPSVTPTKCIATVKFSKEDIQESVNEKMKDIVVERKKGKWIPCSERLPKADEYNGDVAKYYLVQNEYGDMLVARYTHSDYWKQIYQLKPISDEIVAWMPLPEPYREERTEE